MSMNDWIEMSGPQDVGGRSMYDTHPFTEQKREVKRQAIETAVQKEDMDNLQMLARSREGLLNSKLRREAWPILVGMVSESSRNSDYEGDNISLKDRDSNDERLPQHSDEPQVKLDVDRAFNYDNENSEKINNNHNNKTINIQKDKLQMLICRVLRRNPNLSYYQGFHDIAQVVLMVFGGNVNQATPFLEHITLHYLRDFMMPSLHGSVDQLQLIPPLLSLADPYIGDLVRDSPPYYALSSIITIFTHHVRSFDDICTIFDFVFASSMHMPLFLYVALVTKHKRDLKEVDGDADLVHSVLSSIADREFDVFELTSAAEKLSEEYDLSEFQAWDEVSRYSALKLSSSCNQTDDRRDENIPIRDMLENQISEANTRMVREEEKRRKQLEQPRASSLPQKPFNNNVSWLLSKNGMPTLVGLSLCIGVCGVVVSLYHDNIRSTFRGLV